MSEMVSLLVVPIVTGVISGVILLGIEYMFVQPWYEHKHGHERGAAIEEDENISGVTMLPEESKHVPQPTRLIVVLVYVGFILWTSAYIFMPVDRLFLNSSSLLTDPDTTPPLFSLKFLKSVSTLLYIGYVTIIFITTFKLGKRHFTKYFRLFKQHVTKYFKKHNAKKEHKK